MISKHQPLTHFNTRPPEIEIDTLVIHSMFSETCLNNPLDPLACIEELNRYQVSSHYLIETTGELWQLVDENNRAWHAGESTMPVRLCQRAGVNDFSIGIELIGKEDQGFTEEQYRALASLTENIALRHPLRFIVGHQEIALPKGRKTDLGSNFDWDYYRKLLLQANPQRCTIRF